jgi:hypothetical protein
MVRIIHSPVSPSAAGCARSGRNASAWRPCVQPGQLRRWWPSGFHADDRPAALADLLQYLLGAAGVVELALAVVMEDEQAKGWLVLMLGELEHGDIAVRVASSQERPAAGAAQVRLSQWL